MGSGQSKGGAPRTPAADIGLSGDFVRALDGSSDDLFIASVRERVEQELLLERETRRLIVDQHADTAAREIAQLLELYGSVPPQLREGRKQVVDAEQSVVQCYLKSNGRPLDCQDEVARFRALVREEHAAVVAQS